jgi:lipopolysaccharide/colanic/teichoic acid biosynthesis glycosyltransferase
MSTVDWRISSVGTKRGGDPLSTTPGYTLLGKRIFDLVVGLVSVVVLAPLFVIAALSVLVTMGTPVFFRQRRPGRHGEPFEIVKLRTMRPPAAGEHGLESDAERLTPIGRLLRATSIDELPELWNVIRGDMSLVGPRPLLMDYLDRYTPEQARRHVVRPGITGWAQVHGRNALTWEEKFVYDVWYVDHVSFGLDLRILLMTVSQILRHDSISAPGHATMPEFRGTRHE